MKSLATREVRYLVVGGYAVNAFGYVRNTVDIDIWIAGDASNRERTIQAVRDFGFSSVSHDLLEPEDALVRMGVPPSGSK